MLFVLVLALALELLLLLLEDAEEMWLRRGHFLPLAKSRKSC